MVIPSYPVECHMMLEKFGNASVYVNGAVFSMTSTIGVVSTYQLSQSSSSLQTVTSAPSTTASSFPPTSTSGVSLSSGVASPTTFSTSSSSSRTGAESTTGPVASPASGLSVGVKAGIGIGAAIVALLLVLSVLGYIFLSRRRNRGADDTRPGAPTSHPIYSEARHPTAWAYRADTPEARQFNVWHELGTDRAPEMVRQELEAEEHK